jgi:hypothetical protein
MTNLRIILLFICFLFLFQIFYYAADFYNLYIVSKILFPIITLVLTYLTFIPYFLNRKSLYPYTWILVGSFFYFVISASLMAYLNYQQSLIDGVASELKFIPIFFYFATILIFEKAKVSIRDIQKSFMLISVVSLIAYIYFSIFYPEDMAIAGSKVFLHDSVRGYRIILPLTIIEIYLFYICRKSFIEFHWINLLYVFMVFVYLIYFYKERAELIGIFLTIVFTNREKLGKHLKATFIILCVLGITLLLLLPRLEHFQINNIGESAQLRLKTAGVITNVLSNNYISVIFGVGNLLKTNTANFQSVYGEFFWPSDVGWLGIVFESGILGVFIIFYILKILLKESADYRMETTPTILLALRDYVLLTIILSPMIPPLFYNIGIYATIMGIFVYFNGFNKIKK